MDTGSIWTVREANPYFFDFQTLGLPYRYRSLKFQGGHMYVRHRDILRYMEWWRRGELAKSTSGDRSSCPYFTSWANEEARSCRLPAIRDPFPWRLKFYSDLKKDSDLARRLDGTVWRKIYFRFHHGYSAQDIRLQNDLVAFGNKLNAKRTLESHPQDYEFDVELTANSKTLEFFFTDLGRSIEDGLTRYSMVVVLNIIFSILRKQQNKCFSTSKMSSFSVFYYYEQQIWYFLLCGKDKRKANPQSFFPILY